MRSTGPSLVVTLSDGSTYAHPLDVKDESAVREWMRLAWQGEVPEGAVVHIEEVS
jgi:hypothetical protein